MNRKMKEALQVAFEAPAPAHRQDFFENIPQERVNLISFMLSQAGYIRKRVFVISLFPVLLSLAGACVLDFDMMWIISAFMPFLALSAVTENFRSAVYGMEELEMSARFSLKSVVLARMGILGALHLVLLCLLMPLACVHSIFTVAQTGVYLLISYLLADVTGLWILRNLRGKEGLYACIGAAVCISSFYSLLQVRLVRLLYRSGFAWAVVLLVILLILCVSEMKKMVRQTEELRWSLP